MKVRKCKICSSILTGRRDQLFCSIVCKNYYHTNLRRVTNNACKEIDNILHRNRSILLEIIGKNKTMKKVSAQILDEKKFNYKYHTHTYINKKGKLYKFVFDLGWMSFTNQEIIIVRAANY